jgi:outer membrane protein assembly factor BamB
MSARDWNRLLPFLLLILAPDLFAGDWPMWRYDPARSAASPDEIATKLTLLWSRKLPPPRQAWPLEVHQRLNFDASYEPVVMDSLMFLGSPNDGSVTAYDTATGTERWRFYTEGPVRCAPAYWQGRVYAGSDDGYLYCLEARTGGVVWKARGAPPDRPDRRHLGNEHLVSFWPVRGGPVVVDGVVYFGAGVWSVFGVFLHALDAQTGKARWTNGELNYLAHVRADHEQFLSHAGLSPQGYLVATGDRLVVPCGRSMPAGLELATGKLIYYLQGARNGDCRVATHGGYAFVGKYGVVNLQDFRETVSLWAGRGGTKPEGYQNTMNNPQFDMYEAPYFPYKRCEGCEVAPAYEGYTRFGGCDASSAFDSGVAYCANNGTFYAHDLTRAKISKRDIVWGGAKQVWTWIPKLIWQYQSPYKGQPGNVVIKAGNRLYGHVGRKLVALDVPRPGKDTEALPTLTWEQDLPGTPTSLVAADNKLFVATAEGWLCCFGQAAEPSAAPLVHAGHPRPLEPQADAWSGWVEELVQATGAKAGYGLVLGLTNGRLIEELLKATELTILGVDADAAKVEKMRRHFHAAGFYGTRVELFVGVPGEFPFPPYLASLIVSEDGPAAGVPGKAAAARLFNSLRPYGGTLGVRDAGPGFDAWARGAQAPNAQIKRRGNWSLLVRSGPLPGSAPWTHDAADAARSFCSQDDLVQAPLGILWYGDQNGSVLSNHALDRARPQVSGGRVYVLSQIRQAAISAYDAYTGRFLWRQAIECSAYGESRHTHFVALADGIYLAVGRTCCVLDPDTGRTVDTFTFQGSGTTMVKGLRVDGDVIMIACSDVQRRDMNGDPYWSVAYYEASTLVCLDRKTGRSLWRREATQRFQEPGIALAAGRVFCVDSIRGTVAGPANGSTEIASTVLALDARTGKDVWSRAVVYPAEALRDSQEWVAYAAHSGLLLTGRGRFGNGYVAQTGQPVWEKQEVGHAPMILREATFVNRSGVFFALATGLKTGKSVDLSDVGCNYTVGSKHLLMALKRSAWYADAEQGRNYNLRNVRSGCLNSLLAADGLVNVQNFNADCVCNFPIQTSFALAPLPECAAWAGAAPLQVSLPPAQPASTPASSQD